MFLSLVAVWYLIGVKKMQLWQGRFQKALDPKTNDFNSSIAFDSRMYKEDIDGSIAHATMLCAQNIISADDLQNC